MENEVCINCAHGWYDHNLQCCCCLCSESPYWGEATDFTDYCDEWQPKDRKEEDNNG
ncbi:MAG: hypothetical protein IIZ34_06150 [Eubacterium sp.]|nr:hypothetical protein [Eubacterium sp.]